MSKATKRISPAVVQLPAGATGEEKRYLLGVPDGVNFEMKLSKWVALLELARQNGWQPAGTVINDVQFFQFKRTGKVTDFIPNGVQAAADAWDAANADWDGSYTADMGQAMEDDDVRAMAAALKKGMAGLADKELLADAKEIVEKAELMDYMFITSEEYGDIREKYLNEPLPPLAKEDELTPNEMAELKGALKQDGWTLEVRQDGYLDMRFPKVTPAVGSRTRLLYEGIQATLEGYGAYKVGLPPLGLVTTPQKAWRLFKGE